MSKIQETDEAERSEKGWSAWDMLAAGLGWSLFPRFGDQLAMVARTEEEREIAKFMSGFREDSDAYTLEEEQQFWDVRNVQTYAVLDWMSKNPARVFEITDEKGRVMMALVGEGLIYFGLETKSFPGRDQYEGRDGAELWSADAIKHGQAFANSDLDASVEGFEWLKKWLWHIWS